MTPARLAKLFAPFFALSLALGACADPEADDAGASDSGSGAADSGAADSGPRLDSGGLQDAGLGDAGAADTGPGDAELSDMGLGDLGPADTGTTADAGDADAGDADAGDADAGDDAGSDAGAADGGVDAGTTFAVLVTESPAGPGNQNIATWAGVLTYLLPVNGAPLVRIRGIDRNELADPAGLAFRVVSSELFVGNRHGNVAADGVAGSVNRFAWSSAARTLTITGTITGNGLSGCHQMAFDPVSGELYVANVVGGISRFTFDGQGNAVPNGVLGSGSMRGVAIAPDGLRVYGTSSTSDLRLFDPVSGNELAALSVSGGNAGLHYFAIRQGELYVAALYENRVIRLSIGSGDALTVRDSFTSPSPIGVAFSPDEQEMFVSGHQSVDVIQRFSYDTGGDTWIATTTATTPNSLGGILTLP